MGAQEFTFDGRCAGPLPTIAAHAHDIAQCMSLTQHQIEPTFTGTNYDGAWRDIPFEGNEFCRASGRDEGKAESACNDHDESTADST
jgi:hypothetical protein